MRVLQYSSSHIFLLVRSFPIIFLLCALEIFVQRSFHEQNSFFNQIRTLKEHNYKSNIITEKLIFFFGFDFKLKKCWLISWFFKLFFQKSDIKLTFFKQKTLIGDWINWTKKWLVRRSLMCMCFRNTKSNMRWKYNGTFLGNRVLLSTFVVVIEAHSHSSLFYRFYFLFGYNTYIQCSR